jgi:hypothetical protein
MTSSDHPCAAERARTALHRTAFVTVIGPGGDTVWTALQAVEPTGAVVLVTRATEPLVAAARAGAVASSGRGPGLAATLEAREESPLPLPFPIRTRVRLDGRLRELPADGARSAALEIAVRRAADELLDIGAGHTPWSCGSTRSSWWPPTRTGPGSSRWR